MRLGSNFAPQKRTSSLPTTVANGRRSSGRGGQPRGRQIQKIFNNIKITILYGFVTISVLRCTIDVNLSSSESDAVNQNLIEETNRILAEIGTDSDPTDPAQPEQVLFLNETYTLGPNIVLGF